jgi:uncharacterized coiled-coil protein SlyX
VKKAQEKTIGGLEDEVAKLKQDLSIKEALISTLEEDPAARVNEVAMVILTRVWILLSCIIITAIVSVQAEIERLNSVIASKTQSYERSRECWDQTKQKMLGDCNKRIGEEIRRTSEARRMVGDLTEALDRKKADIAVLRRELPVVLLFIVYVESIESMFM